MMRRKTAVIIATTLGYGIVCGVVLGALYIKTTEPGSTAGAFWIEYVSLGVFPALAAFWLPRILWVVLAGVAGSLAVELVVSHLVIGCFTGRDCLETTLAATAVPFIYLYFIVSMPVSIIVSTLVGRRGSSE